METNQGRELAGCRFTHQLEWGAAVVPAANRNCLALSVLSLFRERNRLYKWFMGTFISPIHFTKVCYWSRYPAHKNEVFVFKKNNASCPTCDLTVGTTLSEARNGAVGRDSMAQLPSAVHLPSGALPSKSTFLQEALSKVSKKTHVLQSLPTFDGLRGKKIQIYEREEVSLGQNWHPL